MLPINIDISDTIQEFSLTKEKANELSRYILDSVVDSFVRAWEEDVDNTLHQTRTEYKKGIFQENPDEHTIVVGLTPRQSSLSLMLEDGATQFDIKEGMAKSPNRHLKKNGGWFISVPFRFATSDAVAESMSFSNQMPKPIERIVKQKEAPLTLGDLPAEFLFNKEGYFQPFGQNATSGYTHKFNIYEGLHREEVGSGEKEKRGQYMNFRRISDRSDNDAWIHPGFEAHKFMEKAIERIDIGNIVDHAIDTFLSEN